MCVRRIDHVVVLVLMDAEDARRPPLESNNKTLAAVVFSSTDMASALLLSLTS